MHHTRTLSLARPFEDLADLTVFEQEFRENMANAVNWRMDQNVRVDRVHVASILAASTLVTFTFSPVHPDEGPSVAELLDRHDDMLIDMTLHNHIVDLASSVSGPAIEVNVQNHSVRINSASRFVVPATISAKVCVTF